MLREYKIDAYEIELHRELTKLEKSFEKWKNGTINNGEFSYRIHQYEKGPGIRRDFSRLVMGKDYSGSQTPCRWEPGANGFVEIVKCLAQQLFIE